MKPHKHAELIKAWADGAEIEELDHTSWVKRDNPCWFLGMEYRIKPAPKPDIVKYIEVYPEARGCMSSWKGENDNLRLTWDSETRRLKKAEVL
jgi:hypothetical protein